MVSATFFCTAALERRSEEHTSELQSQSNLVCRLLLEKKKHCVAFPTLHDSFPPLTTSQMILRRRNCHRALDDVHERHEDDSIIRCFYCVAIHIVLSTL